MVSSLQVAMRLMVFQSAQYTAMPLVNTQVPVANVSSTPPLSPRRRGI